MLQTLEFSLVMGLTKIIDRSDSMSVNNILLVLGSLVVASITWLLVTVSELSGDVKVIKYQVNQNSEDLKILTAKE
jgi:hypothetical protein